MTGQATGTSSPGVAAPRCAYEKEARFAVVLYGGVSLAIYINGIVEELWHLVRASAPAVPTASMVAGTRAMLDDARLSGTEKVYRKLAQMLSVHGVVDGEVAPDRDLRTRFVVDILSGSSAGGINAIVLGKALANDTEGLQQIHDLWISEGDIARLVNDARSVADIDGLQRQKPPRSVLNSERMYYRLLEAFDGMDASSSGTGESRLVDELDCWITTTDLHGLAVEVQLADRSIPERRYKNVYHFVYRSSHTSASGVETSFTHGDNPFLAFAARCTSSFPGAFDPMQLGDIDPIVALNRFSAYTQLGSASTSWSKYTPAYVKQTPEFRQRSFGDGGILDNKPFTWATGTLARRRADIPVDRRLLYLEPSPDPIGVTAVARPNAVDTALDAYTLPRQQPILEDIDALRRRNQELLRINDALLVLDRALIDDPDRAMASRQHAAWASTPLSTLVRQRGMQWASYHRLHVGMVLDEIAGLLGGHLGIAAESDAARALRLLAQVWFEETYQSRQTAFLSDYSLGYRLRRLHFIDKRIERLLCMDDAELAAELALYKRGKPAGTAWHADFRAALWDCKPGVNRILIQLRTAGRGLRRDEALTAAIASLGFADATDLVTKVLDNTRTPDEAMQCARALVSKQAELLGGLRAVAGQVADSLRPTFVATGNALHSLLTPEPTDPPGRAFALDVLRFYSEAYEDYDAALLPLTYGGVGEAGYVEVMRVSPDVATMLLDQSDGRHKLGGDTFGHFGGFFSAGWRRNDMMWGRLDAAERLVRTLLPWDGDPRRGELVASLVREAHIAILHEERAAVFPDFTGTDDELYAFVQNDYTVDLQLDQQQMMATAERGMAVTSVVFDDMARQQGASAVARAGSSLFGRLLSVVATALAHSTANLLAAEVVLVAAVFGIAMSTDITWLAWLAGIVVGLGVAALVGITLLRRRVARTLTPVPPPAPPQPPAPPPAAP
jgi:patatin-related protein